MPFLNRLTLSPFGERWYLQRALVYRYKGRDIVVPPGFVTDLASTPRIFWSLLPPFGPHSRAAVVHDWLYQVQTTTRLEADRIFLTALREDGVPYARLLYWAVRLGGWLPWRRYAARFAKTRSQAPR